MNTETKNMPPVWDRLIAALEAQIEKQEEIIRTQEETIRILSEHNDELMKLLRKSTKH